MTTPTTTALQATDLPSHQSREYLEALPGWTRNRDVRRLPELLRTRTANGRLSLVNSEAEQYLPRFEAEEIDDYVVRIALTHPYDALEQTIGALVGLIFRTDPEPAKDAKPQLLDWLENFDGQGRTASQVLQEASDAALTDGHAALLVEFPELNAPPSDAQARDEDIRPWVTVVKIDQILNWSCGTLRSRRYLKHVTILDVGDEPVGTFGTKPIRRYRVYHQEWLQVAGRSRGRVRWELWAERGDTRPVLEMEGYLKGPESIPLFPVYGGQQTGILTSRPPLDGLAFSNIDHTQVKSDRRYSMHKCAIPIPIFINRVRQQSAQPGASGGDLVASSSRGIDIGPGGDAKYMEPMGTALGQLRTELEDIERRMGQQGAGMWRADSSPQTATFNVIQFGQQKSKLGRLIASLSSATNGAVRAMGDYANVKDPGTVAFRRDLTRFGLNDQQLGLLTKAEQDGQLTLATLLRILKSEAILPEDLDIEEEVEAVRRETELRTPDFGGFGAGGQDGTDPSDAGKKPDPGSAAPGTEGE